MKKLKVLTIAILLLGCAKIEQPMATITISDISTNEVHLSGNPIYVTVSTDVKTGSNYKLLLQVTSVDDVFPDPSPDAIAPIELSSEFEISGLVNLPVDYDFLYPVTFLKQEHPSLVLNVNLLAGERYTDANGDLQENWNETPQVIRVVKGGLSPHRLAAMGDTTFHEMFVEAYKFLTWQSRTKVLPMGAPDKLWFFTLEGHSTQATYEVTYTDGSTSLTAVETLLNTNKLIELSPFSVFEALPDELTPGKTVQQIKFRVSELGEEGDSNSEYFTYIIDHDYYEQQCNIFYANSLSVIDMLWCTGKFQLKLNTETTVSTRKQQRGDSQKIATMPVTSKLGQRKWEINTGFKSKEELAGLADFVLSQQIWLADGNKLIPCYLEDKEQLMYDLQQDLDSLDFVLLEAHKSPYF